ncbi:MAG: hypothetical protein V2A73_13915 [Pseudomonadota bacterium]
MGTPAKFDGLLREVWLVEDQPAEIKRLLPVAVRALFAEDRRLALALAASPRNNPCWNYGLIYSVFETTLVYEIFKALLPMAAVEWEWPYPGSTDKADLVVFDGERANVVIEAKWWMSNQKKVFSLLEVDIEKMLSWKGLDGRYLLTFWHSQNCPEMWKRDLSDVLAFCGQYDGARVEPVYAAAFPTDVVTVRAEGGSYFAMCALSVRPRHA